MSPAVLARSAFVAPIRTSDSGPLGDSSLPTEKNNRRNRIATDTETAGTTSVLPCGDRVRTSSTAEDVSRPNGILVIEDERLLRKALKEGFQHRGFHVWAAADGVEGVELYQQFWPQIDMVLSDVQMPVLDGPATLDALREINPSVRFCFMTGDTRAATRARLLCRGALRVFEKPLPPVAVVAQELWELAIFPYHLVVEPDLRHAGTDTPEGSLPEAHDREMPADHFFAVLFSSIARVRSRLGKPQ